jgi:hypothetical protein
MNPLPSTAKTQFIKRAQFLAKDSGAARDLKFSIAFHIAGGQSVLL